MFKWCNFYLKGRYHGGPKQCRKEIKNCLQSYWHCSICTCKKKKLRTINVPWGLKFKSAHLENETGFTPSDFLIKYDVWCPKIPRRAFCWLVELLMDCLLPWRGGGVCQTTALLKHDGVFSHSPLPRGYAWKMMTVVEVSVILILGVY